MKGLFLLIFLFTLTAEADAIVYERFEQDGKVGIRDDQGHVVVPASFDALGWSDGSFTVIGQITGYRKGARWGLLNLKREFITKALYLSLTYPGGDRTLVSREVNSYATKFGCVNLQGEVVVPFIYDAIEIHDLRAVVMQKNGTRYAYGLIDLNNRNILPLIYQKISPLGTLRYAVQDFSDKTAICSEEGKWSTAFDIDSVSAFQYDLAVLYKNLHLGVIDRSGEIRLEPLYRDVKISEPGKVQTKKADAWKVIDLHQKELRRLDADVLEPIGRNRNRVKFNGLSGVVDSVFNKVLPIEFDYVGPVVEEKLIVRKENRYGLIRTSHSVILPIEFDSLILEGHLIRAAYAQAGIRRWDLYDTVGVKKTAGSYEFIGPWNGKFFPVREHGYYGAIDRVGKVSIACVYDSLLSLDESHCVVKFRGQFGAITLDDHWKILPQHNPLQLLPGGLYMQIEGGLQKIMDFSGQLLYFTDNPLFIFPDHLVEKLSDGTEKEINFQGQVISRRTAVAVHEQQSFQEHEGLTVIRRDGKFGFVDNRGRLRIANRYEGAGDFNEGLAPIRLLGKWGFIDKTDQIIIQPAYDRMPIFRDGVAHVVRNGKEGLIDRSGALLLDLRYDTIRHQPDGSYLLIKDGLMGLADAAGKILLEPRFETLEPAGPDHVIVKQTGRYGLLTRDGLSVFPIQYDHLVYQRGTESFFARESFPWETIEIK